MERLLENGLICGTTMAFLHQGVVSRAGESASSVWTSDGPQDD